MITKIAPALQKHSFPDIPTILFPTENQMNMAGVYLIHLDEPYKHSQHYIGWAANIRDRVKVHETSGHHASPFLRAVNKAGIKWRVVRVWPNQTRTFERRLKNSKSPGVHCPVCASKYRQKRKEQMKKTRMKVTVDLHRISKLSMQGTSDRGLEPPDYRSHGEVQFLHQIQEIQ